MQKNDLVKWKGSLYRILKIQDSGVLVVDCVKRTMPVWYPFSNISQEAVLTDLQALQENTDIVLECFENASIQRQNEAHKGFRLLPGLFL